MSWPTIGSRVIKNPNTWRPTEFDGWGAGVGVGIVVEPPWDHENGIFDGHSDHPSVDVVWDGGRAFQYVSELLPAPDDAMTDDEIAAFRSFREKVARRLAAEKRWEVASKVYNDAFRLWDEACRDCRNEGNALVPLLKARGRVVVDGRAYFMEGGTISNDPPIEPAPPA